MEKRYYPFSQYLKETFYKKVYKITLDGGFYCPNRDGTISKGGCIFCDEVGSYSRCNDKISIPEQIQTSMELLTRKFKAELFMAYFQSYSNTYAPVEILKKTYDSVFKFDKIVSVSIGTRPDCIDGAKLDLISTYPNPWIEYGLQSMHEKTLKRINRGHDLDCFLKAYEKTKQRGINTCVHVIFGLWETHDEMLETIKLLADLKVDGVKLHMICGLKGTELSEMYKRGEFEFLSEDDYIEICCDALEILPSSTKIHRIAGSGLKSTLVEPKWIGKKFECLNKIDAELIRRDSWQGKFYNIQ